MWTPSWTGCQLCQFLSSFLAKKFFGGGFGGCMLSLDLHFMMGFIHPTESLFTVVACGSQSSHFGDVFHLTAHMLMQL